MPRISSRGQLFRRVVETIRANMGKLREIQRALPTDPSERAFVIKMALLGPEMSLKEHKRMQANTKEHEGIQSNARAYE